MLASPIFWQAPLAKKRLKKRKQKKRFRIPQPKFSRIPESGFPYMVRVSHLTVNECFGSLCFDTNTPAFLMQIMLKNSEKKINIILVRNQKRVYQNKINSSHYSSLQGGKTFCASFCASLIAGLRRAFLCVDCVCLLLEF